MTIWILTLSFVPKLCIIVYKDGPNDKEKSDLHSQALERSISSNYDIVKGFFLH